MVDYIEAHLDLNLTTGEIAGVAGLSKYHFGKAFSTSTGMTLHSFVLGRRIRQSRVAYEIRPAAGAHCGGGGIFEPESFHNGISGADRVHAGPVQEYAAPLLCFFSSLDLSNNGFGPTQQVPTSRFGESRGSCFQKYGNCGSRHTRGRDDPSEAASR